MGMLVILRDTAALIDFDKLLQGVREMQLGAIRDGLPMTKAQLDQAEAQAVGVARQAHYSLETRLMCMPPDQARSLTDQQDYEGRSNAESEACILDAHHRILSFPCVGSPEYDDPDPRIPAPEES
jgi:hypothetical protein